MNYKLCKAAAESHDKLTTADSESRCEYCLIYSFQRELLSGNTRTGYSDFGGSKL